MHPRARSRPLRRHRKRAGYHHASSAPAYSQRLARAQHPPPGVAIGGRWYIALAYRGSLRTADHQAITSPKQARNLAVLIS